MRTVIFDIDGTLSDPGTRLDLIKNKPKDWKNFFARVGEDATHPAVIETLMALSLTYNIVILTGRSKVCQQQTIDWLHTHLITFDELIMRETDDFRPDYEMKKDAVDRLRAEGHYILCAFDDRPNVIKMYRDQGIYTFDCAQVLG